MSDVFVHDRTTGVTERVSVSSDGAQAAAASRAPAISADGRVVVFTSTASDLVPDDPTGSRDVFVHDRQARTTERVSPPAVGGAAHHVWLGSPAVSADGGAVAWEGVLITTVDGFTTYTPPDVFVRDLDTDTVERMSAAVGDLEGVYGDPVLSADGRLVAMTLDATYRNRSVTVGVLDRVTGTLHTPPGAAGPAQPLGALAMSGDGDVVAFVARSDIAAQLRDVHDVYVWRRPAGSITAVSRNSLGLPRSAGYVEDVDVSLDGRRVAFASNGPRIAEGDENGATDVFVHDLAAGATALVSVAGSGRAGAGSSDRPSLSGDGERLAFRSNADDLVDGDNDGRGADHFLSSLPATIAWNEPTTNSPPPAPSDLAIFGTGQNHVVTEPCGSLVRQWVNLSGRFQAGADPDGDWVRTRVEVRSGEARAELVRLSDWGPWQDPGLSLHPVRIHATDDPDARFSWRAQSMDSFGAEGTWSPWCDLDVDWVVPRAPTVTSADWPAGVTGLGAGRPGTVVVLGDDDVVAFEWAIGSGVPFMSVPATPGGDGRPRADLPFTFPEARPYTLRVRALDEAGNRGPATTYEMVVGPRSTTPGPGAGNDCRVHARIPTRWQPLLTEDNDDRRLRLGSLGRTGGGCDAGG